MVDLNDDTYVRWESSVDGVLKREITRILRTVYWSAAEQGGVRSNKGNKH